MTGTPSEAPAVSREGQEEKQHLTGKLSRMGEDVDSAWLHLGLHLEPCVQPWVIQMRPCCGKIQIVICRISSVLVMGLLCSCFLQD